MRALLHSMQAHVDLGGADEREEHRQEEQPVRHAEDADAKELNEEDPIDVCGVCAAARVGGGRR